MTNGDWETSTEGDLDPDLTEEAGYAGWEPRRRRGLSMLYRVLLAALLLAILGSALLVLLR